MKGELTVNDWKYIGEVSEDGILKMEVHSPVNRTIPERLFKLYSLSKYSIDSVLNGRLYGSHPSQFNDLFDCHHATAFGISESEKKWYTQLLKLGYGQSVVSGWTATQLNQFQHELAVQVTSEMFGIVCMTDVPNNVLMWAYYGNNAGFMVEYVTSRLPCNFLGPFPINYQERITEIDTTNHTSSVRALYQFTIKSARWKHESEWRYLVRSENMKKPFLERVDGSMVNSTNYRSRLFQHPKNVVKSVSLGLKFFSELEIIEVSKDGVLKVDINESPTFDLRTKLLDFCIANKIAIRYILRNPDLMSVKLINTEIYKLASGRYELKEY